ncbi:MAG TPA: hypothetical protein VK120_11200 [Sporosarcina sp.]|nr:hypothetical protein [Sporosarcina sp.]
MLIPDEVLVYVERMIYLPIVLKILERDRRVLAYAPLKLNGPYLTLIDQVTQQVHTELRETKAYLTRHQMQVLRLGKDELFTEYQFIYKGYEEKRRYLNLRLRNRSDELLTAYLTAASTPTA